MTIGKVRKLLLLGITPFLAKYGFIYSQKEKLFVRRIHGFDQILDLLYIKYGESVEIEPIISIKSLGIEEIYHKVARKERKYYNGTITVGNNLFKIANLIDYGIDVDTDVKQSYLVEEESDILLLVKIIPKRFEEYAIAYFDKYSSIEEIDKVLNNEPRAISVHNWLYPLRACIAIITAKMNNNPKLNELVKIYEEELEDALDLYKAEFKDLKLLLSL